MSTLLFALAVSSLSADPAAPKLDVQKTAEQIVNDAKAAGKRLGEKDLNQETQRLQKEVLKNLDALIRKAEEPPPESDKSPDTGGSPGSAGSSAANRKQRRDERAARDGPNRVQPTTDLPRTSPSLAKNGSPSERAEPKASAPPGVPDAYKDVWGHLPEKVRQEMDLYFREQFMPRYSDLLRQYYSSLAERGGKNP